MPKGPRKGRANPAPELNGVGLRYVTDAIPGIRRKRCGRGFTYVQADGSRVDDASTLRRIRSLAIPPAWTDVWICPVENGHIQAIGRDSRNRRQYRYHSRWRQVRDEAKFYRALAFAESLPAIREAVDRDLALPGLPRRKVIATVVRLLERTLVRVGNAEYARKNGSYGLTTLRTRHVDLDGSSVRFTFRGKGNKEHEVCIKDPRVARVIERCLDLPGYELFKYVEEDGTRATIESADINEYLREVSGSDFTAKDFRTWAGTVLAAQHLLSSGPADSDNQAKANILLAVDAVARELNNTPTVCRSCYIHPLVFEAYASGSLFDTNLVTRSGTARAGHDIEGVVVVLLRKAGPDAEAA
jgi:DNA topoisomerase-1